MRVGYRVSYFVDGNDDRDGALGLPDHLLCDDTLGPRLDRIKEFLQNRIETSCSNAGDEAGLRILQVSLLGPFPEEQCVVDRRTPEQRLEDATSDEERFWALGDAANSRFEAGDFQVARNHAEELERMLPGYEHDWDYPDAVAKVHIVLGRLALREGDVEQAKRRLIASGRSEGSPVMSSFGPNMTLARDLLLAGERQAVLEHFEACLKFWEGGSDRLEEWAMYVNAGRIPDFGPNLVY